MKRVRYDWNMQYVAPSLWHKLEDILSKLWAHHTMNLSVCKTYIRIPLNLMCRFYRCMKRCIKENFSFQNVKVIYHISIQHSHDLHISMVTFAVESLLELKTYISEGKWRKHSISWCVNFNLYALGKTM